MKRILIMAALAALAWGQQQQKKGTAEAAVSASQAAAGREVERRAQQEIEQRSERVAYVFPIRHGGMGQIAQALRVTGATVYEDQRLKMLVVSAPGPLMSKLGDVVKALDVPAEAPKNVELITYVLEASGQADRAGTVPAILNAVTKQLTDLFGYAAFRVLDSALIRSREGEPAQTGGMLMVGGQARNYVLELRPSVLSTGKGRVIRLERFEFRTQFGGPQVRADFEIGEGQKVVVGKTGLEGTDRALVLVVTGRVID